MQIHTYACIFIDREGSPGWAKRMDGWMDGYEDADTETYPYMSIEGRGGTWAGERMDGWIDTKMQIQIHIHICL